MTRRLVRLGLAVVVACAATAWVGAVRSPVEAVLTVVGTVVLGLLLLVGLHTAAGDTQPLDWTPTTSAPRHVARGRDIVLHRLTEDLAAARRGDAAGAQRRLRAIADACLQARHHLDTTTDPARARELLGDDVHAALTAAPDSPTTRRVWARPETIVTRLEDLA